MNKNLGTLIVTVTVINIFIACFIAFYLTNKSNILLENQKVIEALSMDLDEDIHELEERLIVIEAFVKDIDEDVHSLRK
tara:strand:+ start:157 stop:393 length:237 start_codon:yes stop_codon:yes gene_type:complete